MIFLVIMGFFSLRPHCCYISEEILCYKFEWLRYHTKMSSKATSATEARRQGSDDADMEYMVYVVFWHFDEFSNISNGRNNHRL